MAKDFGQKIRILRLKDILFRHSDREHPLRREDIERRLDAYGMTVNKKTFYSDLETIEEYTGKELLRHRMGRDFGYAIPEEMRDFTLAELKLLSDCVLSAKFLTAEQSYRFLKKLEDQCSEFEARQLHRQVYVTGRVRKEQTEVFKSVDVINRAIGEDRQIRFHYFRWNVKKEKVYKYGPEKYYRISPWALTWDDGKYYLIGDDMDSKERNIRHYRLDRMEDVEMADDCRSFSAAFDGFCEAEYNDALFGMFGGDMRRVQLICENRMAGIILDRFGVDRMLIPVDKDHFKVYVNVIDSDKFYSWVISLGGVRVAGPREAIEKMRSITRQLNDIYGTDEQK